MKTQTISLSGADVIDIVYAMVHQERYKSPLWKVYQSVAKIHDSSRRKFEEIRVAVSVDY